MSPFVQTIPWLRKVTKLPIVLKGVQCVEVGDCGNLQYMVYSDVL